MGARPYRPNKGRPVTAKREKLRRSKSTAARGLEQWAAHALYTLWSIVPMSRAAQRRIVAATDIECSASPGAHRGRFAYSIDGTNIPGDFCTRIACPKQAHDAKWRRVHNRSEE